MERQRTLTDITDQSHHFLIYVDGASRGNPGPAGAGIYVMYNNEAILEKGIYLGEKTNNQAEYLALALALYFFKNICAEKNVTHPHLTIISDSELLIKQMRGEYKIKNPVLAQIKTVIQSLLDNVSYHCKHVMREHNTQADRLANLGVDKKNKIPTPFLKILSDYGLLI